jgi:hypothetical protein
MEGKIMESGKCMQANFRNGSWGYQNRIENYCSNSSNSSSKSFGSKFF